MTNRKLFSVKFRKGSALILIPAFIFLMVGSIWMVRLEGRLTEASMKRDLLREAALLGETIPVSHAAALSFSTNDLVRPEYLRICSQLRAYSRKVGHLGIRTCALKDGKVVSGPQSFSENEPDHKVPGTACTHGACGNYSELDFGTPVVQESLKSNPSKTVIASVPVLHPRTGEILMAVRVIVDADVWNRRIYNAQRQALLTGLIPFLLFLIGWMLIRHKKQHAAQPGFFWRHIEAITCAAVFTTLTVGISLLFYKSEIDHRINTFKSLGRHYTNATRNSFQTLEHELTMISTFFETDEEVSGSEFTAFCDRVLQNSAVRGAAWFPKVTSEQRAAYEQQVRKRGGWFNYPIWEFDESGKKKISAPEQPVYYPMQFVTPLAEGVWFIGFNAACGGDRASGLHETVRTGLLTASGTLQFPVEMKVRPLIVLYDQVLKETQPGIAVLVFHPDESLETISRRADSGAKDALLELVELNSEELQTPYNTHPYEMIAPVFAFGKCYALRISASAEWLDGMPLQSTPVAAGCGMALTLALTWIIGVIARRPAQLEAEVALRTKELKDSEHHQRAILDATNDAFFIADLKAGVLVDVNRRAEKMYGYPKEEMIGRSIAFISSGVSPYTEREALKWVLKVRRGKPQLIEWQAKHADGTLFPVEVSVRSEIMNDRHMVIASVRDISERKASEARLKESEERLRLALAGAEQGLYDLNVQTGECIVSPEYALMLGFDPDTFVESNAAWAERMHPDDREKVYAEFESYISGKTDTYHVEFRQRTQAGAWLWVLSMGKLVEWDEDGRPLRMLGTHTDINQRKLADEALRKSEQRRASHIENTPLAVIEWDLDWKVTAWNAAAEKVFGYTPSEALGLPATHIVPEKAGVEIDRVKRLISLGEGGSRSRNWNITKNGRLILCDWHNTILTDEAGNMTGVAALALDVTEADAQQSAMERLVGISGEAGQDDLQAMVLALREISSATYTFIARPESGSRMQTQIAVSADGIMDNFGYELVGTPCENVIDKDTCIHPAGVAARFPEDHLLAEMGIEAYISTPLFNRDKECIGVLVALFDYPLEGVGWIKSIIELYAASMGAEIQRRQLQEALEKRIISLTRPLDTKGDIHFEELFNLKEIQCIQDTFSAATGVASIITLPDGTPLTEPSNFTRLCSEIIRGTEKGCANCFKSDAALGEFHPAGPIVQCCMSGGLWDAGASIEVGGKHVANWLIGQVRDEAQSEETILAYSREIGADETEFMDAFREVPVMPREQFGKIADALFTLANQLSGTAYQNVQQARFISERKAAAVALHASQQSYANLVANLPGAAYRCRISSVPAIEFISDGVLELSGYSPEDLVETRLTTWPELIHPEDQEWCGNRFMEFLNHQDTFEAEYRILTRDGQTKWILERSIKVYSEDEKSAFFEGFVSDITEQRKARQTLDNFFEQSINMHAVADLSGTLLRVNKGWETVLQYSSEELKGRNTLDMIHPDDIPISRDHLEKLEQGIPFSNLINRYRRKDGEYRTIQWSANISPADQLIYAIGIDVTERKKAEEQFRSLATFAPVGIYMTDTEGQCIYVNPRWLEMAGMTKEEAQGEGWALAIHPDDRNCVFDDWNKTIGSKGGFEMEYRFVTPGGHETWIFGCAIPLKDHLGNITGYIGINSDVTEAREARLALEKHARELERFNKAAVGRELRMIELKKEINTLSSLLDRGKPYPLHSDSKQLPERDV